MAKSERERERERQAEEMRTRGLNTCRLASHQIRMADRLTMLLWRKLLIVM